MAKILTKIMRKSMLILYEVLHICIDVHRQLHAIYQKLIAVTTEMQRSVPPYEFRIYVNECNYSRYT
ncbi:hypothetical protein P4388_15905 [Bacillus thuringiensis]|nr:hypothetical protein [Bacillus thuringiensis]MRB11302.1 hypothetical protein [Bacillus thuringiensis]